MKRSPFRLLSFVCLVGLLLLPAATRASDFVFSWTEENDLFSVPHTDRHYTQGIRFQLLWPEEQMFSFLRKLPDLGIRNASHRVGLAVSQEIYTPENLEVTSLITTDRPYAGWLYLGAIREVLGVTGKDIPTFDRVELDLGIVGPYSLSDEAQNWWHGVVHVDKAYGWRNQLPHEPGLLLRAQRRWLLWETQPQQPLQLQLIPDAELKLGNVETSLGLHAMMRVGHNIPDDFRAFTPAQPKLGWYFFGRAGARAVGYNIFLDGPLFGPSPLRMDIERAVLEYDIGFVLELWQAELSYTWHFKTKEFHDQNGYDTYASLNLTYRF